MDQIKVGPVVYQVKVVEGLENGDGESLWGQAFHKAHEIRLSTNHTKESRFLTTWHEVIHVFESVYGLNLPEETVTILGAAICQVLQDNPALNWTEYSKEEGQAVRADASQIKQEALKLCWKIEELPASELQTEISIMANELKDKLGGQL